MQIMTFSEYFITEDIGTCIKIIVIALNCLESMLGIFFMVVVPFTYPVLFTFDMNCICSIIGNLLDISIIIIILYTLQLQL